MIKKGLEKIINKNCFKKIITSVLITLETSTFVTATTQEVKNYVNLENDVPSLIKSDIYLNIPKEELIMTDNKSVNKWIEEMKNIVNPDKVVLIDGSEEQLEALRKEACDKGEIIKLNQDKHPGCYLRRSAHNDVARAEDRTFICTKTKQEAGPTNNWWKPEDAYKKLYEIAKDSYKGKTMYVIPYSMGVPGSKFAKIGIELTDSIYATLNMAIMTRVGNKVLEKLGDSNDWVRGLHCSCDIDAEKRYVCHFPEDNTIISVNSGYGGNVLLGKKCFALRIASFQGKKEK